MISRMADDKLYFLPITTAGSRKHGMWKNGNWKRRVKTDICQELRTRIVCVQEQRILSSICSANSTT